MLFRISLSLIFFSVIGCVVGIIAIGIAVGILDNQAPVLIKKEIVQNKNFDKKNDNNFVENKKRTDRTLFLNGEWIYFKGKEKRVIDFDREYFFDYVDLNGKLVFNRRGWFVVTDTEIVLNVMKQHGVERQGPPEVIQFKIIKYETPAKTDDIVYVKDVVSKGPQNIELELDGKKLVFSRN